MGYSQSGISVRFGDSASAMLSGTEGHGRTVRCVQPSSAAPSFTPSKATWIQVAQLRRMEEHDAEDDKHEHADGK